MGKGKNIFLQMICAAFLFIDVNKITCLKLSKQSFKKGYLCMLKYEDREQNDLFKIRSRSRF